MLAFFYYITKIYAIINAVIWRICFIKIIIHFILLYVAQVESFSKIFLSLIQQLLALEDMYHNLMCHNYLVLKDIINHSPNCSVSK
jgi:hypothetical protein